MSATLTAPIIAAQHRTNTAPRYTVVFFNRSNPDGVTLSERETRAECLDKFPIVANAFTENNPGALFDALANLPNSSSISLYMGQLGTIRIFRMKRDTETGRKPRVRVAKGGTK